MVLVLHIPFKKGVFDLRITEETTITVEQVSFDALVAGHMPTWFESGVHWSRVADGTKLCRFGSLHLSLG